MTDQLLAQNYIKLWFNGVYLCYKSHPIKNERPKYMQQEQIMLACSLTCGSCLMGGNKKFNPEESLALHYLPCLTEALILHKKKSSWLDPWDSTPKKIPQGWIWDPTQKKVLTCTACQDMSDIGTVFVYKIFFGAGSQRKY